jgi:transcription initiation factor TFIIIB Brf1 subunit/transcription initiation factor TFIIB
LSTEIEQKEEHIHSMIFDPESGEEICTGCGQVAFVRGFDKEEQELPNPNFTLTHNLHDGKPDPNSNPTPTAGYIVPKQTDLDFSCGGFLSTKIDARNTDAVGKRVNSAHFNKMRFINNYILSSTEMSTYKNAIWNVASISDRLNLPGPVKERAAEIFKRIYNHKNNIHNSKNVVCACIYHACREARIFRKMPDIASAAMEKPEYTSQIFRTYRKLLDSLKLNVTKNFPIIEEISNMGSRAAIPESIVRDACSIYTQVKNKDRIYFAGKSARITAATLIWIAAYHRSRIIDDDSLADDASITSYILHRRVNEHFQNTNYFDEYADRRSVALVTGFGSHA